MSHLWRTWGLVGLLVALSWLSLAAGALAHEVRPALLQIIERPAGGYDITWKQPVVGDMAIRLSPHLSGGALDRPPDRCGERRMAIAPTTGCFQVTS